MSVPWIVSDFGLVDAIESGITKIPRLPVQDTTGRPDPRYFRLWEAIRDGLQPGVDRTPPCVITVCDNTDIAEKFYRRISGEQVIEKVTEAEVQEVLEEEEGEDEASTTKRGKKLKLSCVRRASFSPSSSASLAMQAIRGQR